MKATIHYARPGKPLEIFTETLLADNSVRLDTCGEVEPGISRMWSPRWWQNGCLARGQYIARVRKHAFYQRWFAVMELFDAEDQRLGCYCDVVTPLKKDAEGIYHLTDLFLDLWVAPDGSCRTLDLDELNEAARAGLISDIICEQATQSLRWMENEARQGAFPDTYIH